MGTHAHIMIKEKSGKVEGSTVHYDGYINRGVGDILNRYYNSTEKIKELIKLGELATLGSDTSLESGTKAYYRDTQEQRFITMHFPREKNFYEYVEKNSINLFDYIYLWDENQSDPKWMTINPRHPSQWISLKESRRMEIKDDIHEDTIETKAGIYTYPVIDYLPDGWEVDKGALTAPKGYKWIHDPKERLFTQDGALNKLSAIIDINELEICYLFKEDKLKEMEEKQMSTTNEKDINVKIGKGLVGEPFLPKSEEETGRKFVQISIPNEDPQDKSPWRTFILPENQVHEDKKSEGKSVYFYLPKNGTTVVKKQVKIGQDKDGKGIYETETKRYANTRIKELCEAYKTRDKEEPEKKESVMAKCKQLDKELKEQSPFKEEKSISDKEKKSPSKEAEL